MNREAKGLCIETHWDAICHLPAGHTGNHYDPGLAEPATGIHYPIHWENKNWDGEKGCFRNLEESK